MLFLLCCCVLLLAIPLLFLSCVTLLISCKGKCQDIGRSEVTYW